MPAPPDAPRDRLEALLRTTGRREGAGAGRAERIEAAVRAHWQAEVGRRRRSRWLLGALASAAAGVLVALGVLWLRILAPPTIPASARAGVRVEIVSDAVWSRPTRSGAPRSLRTGDDIVFGSEVATEDRGRVALRMGGGHSVRLDRGTRVRVLSERALELDRGAVYVDSSVAAAIATAVPAGSIEIHTPLGTIRDIGTQFEVRCLADAIRVRVREGTIAVHATGSVVEVGAGRELRLGADGVMARRDVSAIEADLDWVEAITPMIDIDGRTLQSFLEWMARERGLRLRFENPEAARSAPAIVLNGSIQGMTLDEALESVLSTCRMSSRLDRDVLLVRSANEAGGR